MSAIVGVLDRERAPVSPELLGDMLAVLAHRGAAAGAWAADGIGLGQRARARGGDAPTVGQPLAHGPTGVVIVADARVDNRAELAAALGVGRETACDDVALILHAYVAWGPRCAARVVGDFAFAIWDPRTRALVLARDGMGVRPLYYHRGARTVAFASEVKALLRVPGVARDLDADEMARFLEASQWDREATMYRAIRRLPAGHVLVVTPEHATTTEYWRPEAREELRLASDAEYEEAFRAVLTEAVRARLRGATRAGTTLSGGLDSSAVTCLARAVGGPAAPPVPAFSLVFPDLDARDRALSDERPYIDAVRRGGGIDWHPVRGDRLGPLDDVEGVLGQLDEPFFAPNLYLHRGLYAAARDAGVDVLLDGFDGDSAVSHGFGRLNGLARRGDWDGFEREVRAFARRRGSDVHSVLAHFGLPYVDELAAGHAWPRWLRASTELARRFGVPRRDLLLRHGVRAALPAWLRDGWRGSPARGASGPTALRPAPWRRVAGEAARRRREGAGEAASERAMHVEGIGQPLYQLTLEMADKCARAHGVEPRYPFFDRRVIELCLSVPEEQKLADGWPRYLFRRAMAGILPPEIQWRSDKGNLEPNFHVGLRGRDAARVRDGVARAASLPALAPLVDAAALDASCRRYLAADGWRGRQLDGYLLFRATVLATWLHGPARDTTPDDPHAPSTARAERTGRPRMVRARPPRPHDRAVTVPPLEEDAQ